MNVVLISLIQTLQTVINIYIWIIIASALMSWVQPNPYNPVVQLIYKLTSPTYNLIRRMIPTTFGMIDIAPIIVILLLMFTSNLLTQLIINAA